MVLMPLRLRSGDRVKEFFFKKNPPPVDVAPGGRRGGFLLFVTLHGLLIILFLVFIYFFKYVYHCAHVYICIYIRLYTKCLYPPSPSPSPSSEEIERKEKKKSPAIVIVYAPREGDWRGGYIRILALYQLKLFFSSNPPPLFPLVNGRTRIPFHCCVSQVTEVPPGILHVSFFFSVLLGATSVPDIFFFACTAYVARRQTWEILTVPPRERVLLPILVYVLHFA